MLNPVFPQDVATNQGSNYVLPSNLRKKVIEANSSTDTYPEYRLQEVYTDEIWRKLRSLNIYPKDLEGKNIADLCAGTGFLTYHLLQRAKPKEVTLIEISSDEISRSKELLSNFKGVKINYIQGDVQKSLKSTKYDLIIGNSFLHHLYDLPGALISFRGALSMGGSFVSLHEPTVPAIGLESGRIIQALRLTAFPDKTIDRTRQVTATGKIRVPGGDVWLFKHGDLSGLLQQSGYKEFYEVGWHFARPLVVARQSLHLSNSKQELDDHEAQQLQRAVSIDDYLRKIIPKKMFGSVALRAIR